MIYFSLKVNLFTSLSTTFICLLNNNIYLFCLSDGTVDIGRGAKRNLLLTRGKHLHDRHISLTAEDWDYKAKCNPPHFVEEPVASQEC
jgi:hypothetical protein